MERSLQRAFGSEGGVAMGEVERQRLERLKDLNDAIGGLLFLAALITGVLGAIFRSQTTVGLGVIFALGGIQAEISVRNLVARLYTT